MKEASKLNGRSISSPIQLRGVVLGYAFEVLGRRTYPDEWEGNEFNALSREIPEDPSLLPNRIAALNEQTKALSTKINEYDKLASEESNPRKRQLLEKYIELTCEERRVVDQEIKSLPNVKAAIRDFAYVKRAKHISDTLIGALAQGTLKAHRPVDGEITDTQIWSDVRHGRFDIVQSTAKIRYGSGNRRQKTTILLDRQDVDDWVNSICPPLTEELSDEDYVLLRIDNCIDAKITPTREQFIQTIKSERATISERFIIRIWSKEAPNEWRSPGPKPNDEIPRPGALNKTVIDNSFIKSIT